MASYEQEVTVGQRSSMAKPAVIVVNSLVARGGVGGRASVFALERLGFPVWLVPTVLLSWHPGQGPATRIVP
jgi:pyridoxine kinase